MSSRPCERCAPRGPPWSRRRTNTRLATNLSVICQVHQIHTKNFAVLLPCGPRVPLRLRPSRLRRRGRRHRGHERRHPGARMTNGHSSRGRSLSSAFEAEAIFSKMVRPPTEEERWTYVMRSVEMLSHTPEMPAIPPGACSLPPD